MEFNRICILPEDAGFRVALLYAQHTIWQVEMRPVKPKAVVADLLERPTGCVVLPSGKLLVAGAHVPGLALLLASGKRAKQQPRHSPGDALTGIACSESSLFVTSRSACAIHQLDLVSLSCVRSVGTPGPGPDQLAAPHGLAVAGNMLYVCDTNNHRIVAYHALLLEPEASFGSEGAGNGELSFPRGLAALGGDDGEEGRLVVADTMNHRLQCFSRKGEFVWVRDGFDEPSGVAVAQDRGGVIAVAERGRLQLLAPDGNPLQVVSLPGALHSVCFGAKHLYATDEAGGQLHVLELPPPLEKASTAGSPPVAPAGASTTTAEPTSLCSSEAAASGQIEAAGEVAPSDKESECSVLLDPDVLSCLFEKMMLQGFLPVASVCSVWATEAEAKARELAVLRYETQRGVSAQGDRFLRHPSHVALLPSGELLVCEGALSELKHLTEDGRDIVAAHGGNGSGPSNLCNPRGLACEADKVFIADTRNHRVQMRTVAALETTAAIKAPLGDPGDESELQQQEGGPPLPLPEGIAAADGALFVSDRSRCRVVVLEQEGLQFRASFGSRGSGDGQMFDPGGLTVLDGSVIVADTANHRLACFSLSGEWRRSIGRYGSIPGRFHMPQDVVAVRTLLIVAERQRLQVLTAAGVPQQVIQPPVCGSLQGLCANDTRVVVADPAERLLHEFSLSVKEYGNTVIAT